jgi:hypothetical protein
MAMALCCMGGRVHAIDFDFGFNNFRLVIEEGRASHASHKASSETQNSASGASSAVPSLTPKCFYIPVMPASRHQMLEGAIGRAEVRYNASHYLAI